MRKAYLLFCLCIACVQAMAQIEVPHQLEFAGMSLTLTEEARRQVATDADALLRHPRFFQLKVDKADAYFPIIDRIFSEEGIPFDFRYLVLQESGLVPDAVSSSNAVGYWQFKKESGQEVGLRVDGIVDERMNIVSATYGAARYLHRHNAVFNNWVYTLLSYNMGLTGAKNVVDARHFGAKRMTLDAKTHWYILKFLSHKVAYEGAIGQNTNPPLRLVEYTQTGGKSLAQVASETQVDGELISEYNKWIKAKTVPTDKSYTVILPIRAEEQAGVLAQVASPANNTATATEPVQVEARPYSESIFASLFGKNAEKKKSKSENSPLFFSWNGIKAIQAQAGDNSATLAAHAGISRDEFLSFNDMKIFDLVVPGQLYYVKKKKRKAQVEYHTVREGETLWDISQMYGLRLSLLMSKNRISKPEKLKEGRVLWLKHIRPDNVAIEYKKVDKKAPVAPTAIAQNIPAPKEDKTAKDSKAEPVQPTAKPTTGPTAKEEAPVQISAPVQTKPAVADNSNKGLTQKNEDEDDEPAAFFDNMPEQPLTNTEAKVTATEFAKPTVVYTEKEIQRSFLKHTVDFGQTLYAISRQYEVPVDSIKHWNNFEENSLRQGQVLLIRKPDIVKAASKNTQVATQAPALQLPAGRTYTVKPGDTLFKISKELGVTVQQLRDWNQKANDQVAVGEQLKVQ